MRQRPLVKPKARYRTSSACDIAVTKASRSLNRAAMDLDDAVSGLDQSAHLPKIAPLRDAAAQLRTQVMKLRDRAEEVTRG